MVIREQPELPSGFPELNRRVSLTCDAEGIPQPNITWFKDGVLLPGEMSRILVIQEVELSDRGRYSCKGVNFDPNKPRTDDNIFEEASEEIVINIKGMLPSRPGILCCLVVSSAVCIVL